MKKVIFLLMICVLLTLSLNSCSHRINTEGIGKQTLKTEDKPVETNDFSATEQASNIIVKSDITLSNNDLYNITGKNEFLRLKMVCGSYFEDWNQGPLMGPQWEGDYKFVLQDEFGKVINETDLYNSYSNNIIFGSSFALEFSDYNNDGDIDFTIGQYASSNGRFYRLFTLRKDGKIEELNINDAPYIFISRTTGYYSTKFTKVDKTTFKTIYYDNSVAKTFECYYRWDRDKFKLVRKCEGSVE